MRSLAHRAALPLVVGAAPERCVVRSTILVPSRNLVRKRTLALLNRPSFKLTTMNCDPLNRFLNNSPICCVWERSRAASTSSKIYIGAGLNWRSDMINERAISELYRHQSKIYSGEWSSYRWPPLSSVKLCFQMEPNWTFTSRPALRLPGSAYCSLALLPGKRSPKISPKSLLIQLRTV